MLTTTAKLPQADFNVLWITLSGYRDIAQRAAIGFDDEGTRVATSKCGLVIDRLIAAIHPSSGCADELFTHSERVVNDNASQIVRYLFERHVECLEISPALAIVEGRFALLYFAQFFKELSDAWQFLDLGNIPQFVSRLTKMQTRCFGEINFSNLLASRGLSTVSVPSIELS